MTERNLTVRVARIARQTPEILSFELVHPTGRALPGYQAGAHIDVHMPGGFSRQYSLACDAGGDGRAASRYLIGVKREAAGRGGSASMHGRVREGDLLPISAPRNSFPVRAEAHRHLLLAGGIGMTPLLAMAESLARAGADFTLCLFVRSEEHLAFTEALRQPLLAPHVRLHFDAPQATQKIDLRQLLAQREADSQLYVCGPAGFMQAVRDAAAHWPEDAVHTEYFAAPADAAGAPGKPFVLRLAQRGIRVPVAADQSAVDALHAVGIDIPVSCEQGLCGTCVVGGEGDGAEHRDFCLTRGERAHKVALCCSRAKSEELVVDL
ncbi:PDR/VanB family oxidoreductase [Variovorax ginsengisoli]|uniref:PDR/VanB family oxidoreductase n=1 Tax=Variovorax ginsengisoli TaxID=363844 RepID=A0ABT8RYW1_9BURK|nr:PDR/VanB family oxidoreductase [Variovorax ginsengisoli]MDN8612042.1 PDR/VanB family oxidoreductase [Variovorax ginsengisoli]MDO1531212.1 PDR/VanB family oxidoreductase [Variovorax ginsengisoli]